jgi:hypothetical protein
MSITKIFQAVLFVLIVIFALHSSQAGSVNKKLTLTKAGFYSPQDSSDDDDDTTGDGGIIIPPGGHE